ncbi:hypothetical protein VTJ04DRAFT_10651 [Mycothermus thermophilus]|uniref:uncharacterized protein n=1 Tax=Humicola insolens TaxID=85995 RepID=UPI0037440E09
MGFWCLGVGDYGGGRGSRFGRDKLATHHHHLDASWIRGSSRRKGRSRSEKMESALHMLSQPANSESCHSKLIEPASR